MSNVSYEKQTRCELPTFREDPITLLKCLISSFTARERKVAAANQNFSETGRGYFMIQSTKPQTLGFSLADSPVSLLAWIYEKLVTWADAYPWTDDEGTYINTHHISSYKPDLTRFAVLTWVSIYWFSRAGPAASIRIYYENVHAKSVWFPKISVPVGLSFFPKELMHLPKVCVPIVPSFIHSIFG
jgi:hypothetical protein